jgi:hypothetical protein
MRKWLKRLRGALGNATLWAGVWTLATVPVLGLLQLFGLGELFGMAGILAIAPRVAASLATMGFVAGGAFSTYLALAPARRLEDVDLRVVGVLGGILAGAMVPMFGFLPSIVSILGTPFPVAVAGAVGIAGLLGAGTAVGSVKVAQRALLAPGADAGSPLGSGSEAGIESVASISEAVATE